MFLEEASFLHRVRDEYFSLSIEKRQGLLNDSETFYEMCQNGGQLGNTSMPEEVNAHFVCYVVVGGALFMLDGDRKEGPEMVMLGLNETKFPDNIFTKVGEHLAREARNADNGLVLALVSVE